MNCLRVVVSPAARDEIEAQLNYLGRHSPKNALAWHERLRGAIARLSDVHGHAIDHSTSIRRGETIRQLVFERTYLLQYRLGEADELVEVLHFRHGARLPRPGKS